jgi:hypothetical protein
VEDDEDPPELIAAVRSGREAAIDLPADGPPLQPTRDLACLRSDPHGREAARPLHAACLPPLLRLDFDRRGIHSGRGEMTVGQVIEWFIVGLAEEHLAQVRAALHR